MLLPLGQLASNAGIGLNNNQLLQKLEQSPKQELCNDNNNEY